MPVDPDRLAPLEVLLGERVEHLDIPGVPDGRMAVERTLGGRALTQTSEVPHADVPDALAIIVGERGTQGFLQHYFDSPGVVRVYRMGFDGTTWTLQRDEEDFSPLDFHQRYTGSVSGDGDSIRGLWETPTDGITWELDFRLDRTRVR